MINEKKNKINKYKKKRGMKKKREKKIKTTTLILYI